MPKSDRNPLVHGSNLEQKENHRTKYRDVASKQYLSEIRTEYDKWRFANLELVGLTSTPTAQDDAIIAIYLESNYNSSIVTKPPSVNCMTISCSSSKAVPNRGSRPVASTFTFRSSPFQIMVA
jgi:hypothetical protein